jgi:Zn-finger nucleic acid-binding protein
MSLQCPVCRVALHPIPNRTGTAAVCAACGGIWLDNAGSRSLITNFLEPVIKQSARDAAALVAQQRAGGHDGGYRAPAPRPAEAQPKICAACGVALAKSLFEPARIELDVCAAHGTWFDAGELWTMAQHFEMKATMDDADAVAFGREMEALRRAEVAADFRAAGLVVGFLRR